MKNILLPFAFIISIIISNSSFATLNPGDIMIVGFMGDGDGTSAPTATDPPSANCGDGFSFLCMVDIPNGEQVIFTEEEWTPAGFNSGNEGHVIWTNNTGIAIRAGTVIQVTTHGQAEVIAGYCGPLSSTVGIVAFGDDGSGMNNWSLSSSNEEIYVYQGSPGSPTNWISAFFTDEFGVNSFVPTSSPDLTGYVVNLESIDSDADIAVYSGATDCSDPAACLANITNPSNWSTDNGPGFQCCDATGVEYPVDVPIEFEGLICQPPVISCPADIEISCEASTDPAATGIPTFTEGCGIVNISFSDTETPGACANGRIISREWTATDEDGNNSSCTQTITVVDNIAPVPPAAPANLLVQCAADVPAPIDLTATDNCSADITVSPTTVITPGACINDFVMVRTWTFDDGCGNISSVSQTINVTDDVAPLAPAPPVDLALQCADDVPPPIDLTATDNCEGAITVSPTTQITPGSSENDFVIIRTWTFADICGNLSSISQTIRVNDDVAPVAPAAPADLILQCAADVPPPVNLTASDNCDGDITVGPTTQITPGVCANDFLIVRTWIFTDVGGNTSSVSQTISINDDIAPVAPAAPADLVLACAADVPPPVDLTATDNCGGNITVSPTTQIIPGACANDFVMVRTWTFSDVCGNTSSVSQTISVLDDVAPVAPAPPADLILQCTADIPPPVDLTALDNCEGNITVSPTTTIIPGSSENDFFMVRTWTFTDLCGNSSSISQSITVFDNTPPVAICQNITISLDAGGNASITAADIDGGSYDNCTADFDLNYSAFPTNFTSVDIGVNLVTLSVTDENGNTSSCTAQVIVDKRLSSITYTGEQSGQYSDQINLSAVLTDDFTFTGIPGKTLTFTLGTQYITATTDINGVASTTLVLNQAPGFYNVEVDFAGDAIYKESSSSDLFDLLPEDARATYTGAMYASTSSSKSSLAVVTLSATIQDISAVLGSTDLLGGDIRNADVTFIDVSNGNVPLNMTPLPVKLINPANELVGNVVYEWTVDIGNAEWKTFEIGISVNNYYGRLDPSENTMITISKPLDNFVTGGGYMFLEKSAGNYSGDDNSKVNFGANIKFNKKGTNLQGKVQLLVRRTESDGLHTYRIRSNKLNSMAISNGLAEITGKANIEDITDPNFPISISGNQIFELELHDNGEPGISDLIGFTLYGNGGGLLFSSYWTGIATMPQTLDGGNIVIHNKDNTPARIENLDEISSELDNVVHSIELSTYPNPFQEQATIEFILPYNSKATVDIYNLNGVRIKTLFDDDVLANQIYQVVFEREFNSDDMFIYRLNTEFESKYGKLISK